MQLKFHSALITVFILVAAKVTVQVLGGFHCCLLFRVVLLLINTYCVSYMFLK